MKYHINDKYEVKRCYASILCRFKDYSSELEAEAALKLTSNNDNLKIKKEVYSGNIKSALKDYNNIVSKDYLFSTERLSKNTLRGVRQKTYEFEQRKGYYPLARSVSANIGFSNNTKTSDPHLHVITIPYFNEDKGRIMYEWVVKPKNIHQLYNFENSYTFNFDENYTEEFNRFKELSDKFVNQSFNNPAFAKTDEFKRETSQNMQNKLKRVFGDTVSEQIGDGVFFEEYVLPSKDKESLADYHDFNDFRMNLSIDYDNSTFDARMYRDIIESYPRYNLSIPKTNFTINDNLLEPYGMKYSLHYHYNGSDNINPGVPEWSLKINSYTRSIKNVDDIEKLILSNNYVTLTPIEEKALAERFAYYKELVNEVNAVVEERANVHPFKNNNRDFERMMSSDDDSSFEKMFL